MQPIPICESDCPGPLVPETGNGRGTSLWTLDPQHVAAVAVIGDLGVTIALAHVGRMGRIFPYQSFHQPIETPPGQVPGVIHVQAALTQCWTHFLRLGVEHHRFFLVLPAWASPHHSVRATARVEVAHNNPWRHFRVPAVRPADVRRAHAAVCERFAPPGQVVVDFRPDAYNLASGCAVSDPIGSRSCALELVANVTTADAAFTRDILRCLRDLAIRVDAVLPASACSGGILDDTQRRDGSFVLDVGERTTACALWAGHRLVHASWMHLGSDQVLGAVAAQLRCGKDALRRFGQEQRDIASCRTDVNDHRTLPFQTPDGFLRVRDLRRAAAADIEPLVREALRHLDVARDETLCSPERVVVAGDDPIVLHALTHLLHARLAIPVVWWTPGEDGGIRFAEMPHHTRTMGPMRQYRDELPLTPLVLQRFTESLAEKASSALAAAGWWSCEAAFRLAKWMGSKLKRGVERIPELIRQAWRRLVSRAETRRRPDVAPVLEPEEPRRRGILGPVPGRPSWIG
jgi:cell division ATPase FtsA